MFKHTNQSINKMEKSKVTSWIGEIVKIKAEYISVNDEGHQVLTTGNALQSFCWDWGKDLSDLRFHVKQDFFGIDLFKYRNGKVLESYDGASHQLIIEACHTPVFNYPYAWDAKYFEIVK
jgi:hypothetical protein